LLPIAQIPDNTIAVQRFANVAATDSLAPLSFGLAAIVTTDLSKVEQLRVVERERVGVLIEELSRAGDSDETIARPLESAPAGADTLRGRPLVDPGSAPRLGRMLGARRLVHGTFIPVGRGAIQLQGSVVDVADSTRKSTGSPLSGPLPRLLRLEKVLVRQILAALGIEPTEDEWRALMAQPTDNWLAFLAFSRGVYLEERGRYLEAAGHYRRAAAIDPGFSLARERAETCGIAAEDVDRFALDEFQRQARENQDLQSRLLRTATASGLHVAARDDDRVASGASVSDPARVSSATAEIVVSGELPGRGGDR
jgi:hypothetical protein